jgi:hypothetical protein
MALAGLWLRNAARGPDAAVSRNVALLVLAAPLLGLVSWALGQSGGFGISRTLGVLLLGYAILRLQLLDIDVKLKWTIKRGTLAAVFLAVFFVVAQLAQNFLSQSYGLLLGGASAGLLLFAIAPLQRMAERVANAAMPGVGGAPEHRQSRAAEAYTFALRMAYADKVLTREEERGLAVLAEELGLAHTTALALREEVEREAGVASARARHGDPKAF